MYCTAVQARLYNSLQYVHRYYYTVQYKLRSRSPYSFSTNSTHRYVRSKAYQNLPFLRGPSVLSPSRAGKPKKDRDESTMSTMVLSAFVSPNPHPLIPLSQIYVVQESSLSVLEVSKWYQRICVELVFCVTKPAFCATRTAPLQFFQLESLLACRQTMVFLTLLVDNV